MMHNKAEKRPYTKKSLKIVQCMPSLVHNKLAMKKVSPRNSASSKTEADFTSKDKTIN